VRRNGQFPPFGAFCGSAILPLAKRDDEELVAIICIEIDVGSSGLIKDLVSCKYVKIETEIHL
jgi:hypothetical protein